MRGKVEEYAKLFNQVEFYLGEVTDDTVSFVRKKKYNKDTIIFYNEGHLVMYDCILSEKEELIVNKAIEKYMEIKWNEKSED